jgi:hypothetical protein
MLTHILQMASSLQFLKQIFVQFDYANKIFGHQ